MDVAIIGGGASGIICALSIKQQSDNISVTVYEKLPRILKKILVTGNGRCNLTNLNADISGYWGNCNFASSALEKYTPEKNIEFFEKIGLLSKVEDEGRVYPMSSQATSVVNALRCEAQKLGVRIVTDSPIKTVEKKNGKFILNGEFFSDKLVVCAGGSAAKSQGTDGDSFKLLKSLSVKINKPTPALTGVIIDKFPKSLKGTRNICNVRLFIDKKMIYFEKGEVQFNDYGISGIPVMQLSGLVSQSQSDKISIELDCVPQLSKEEIINFITNRRKANGAQSCENVLCGIIPKALADYLLLICDIKKDSEIKTVNDEKIKKLAKVMKIWSLNVQGVREFEFAQVTAGGADCNEFESSTLECKKIKNLYCTGEALDIYGRCGGYNLQWAWSSGRLAADAIIKENKIAEN